jgi:hypothetical protein
VKKESNPHAHAEKDRNREDGDGGVLRLLKNLMPDIHASLDKKRHGSSLRLNCGNQGTALTTRPSETTHHLVNIAALTKSPSRGRHAVRDAIFDFDL